MTRPDKRKSSDSVWPLRRADGRTWAEAKAAEEAEANVIPLPTRKKQA